MKIILNGGEEKALQRRGGCLFLNVCYADFCESQESEEKQLNIAVYMVIFWQNLHLYPVIVCINGILKNNNKPEYWLFDDHSQIKYKIYLKSV